MVIAKLLEPLVVPLTFPSVALAAVSQEGLSQILISTWLIFNFLLELFIVNVYIITHLDMGASCYLH